MKKGKNDYYPTWYSKYEFEKLDPVYPIGIKEYILGKGFIKQVFGFKICNLSFLIIK